MANSFTKIPNDALSNVASVHALQGVGNCYLQTVA